MFLKVHSNYKKNFFTDQGLSQHFVCSMFALNYITLGKPNTDVHSQKKNKHVLINTNTNTDVLSN